MTIAATQDAEEELAALWWLFGLGGLLAIAFGMVARFLPSAITSVVLMPASLLFFILLSGLYVISNGFALLIGGVYAFDHRLKHAGLILVEGGVAVVFGLYIAASLALSVPQLSVVFGIHAALLGSFRLVLFFRVRRKGRDRAAIGVLAVFAYMAAIYFIVARNTDMRDLISCIALYSLLTGLIEILVSIWLRRHYLASRLTSG